MSEEKKFIGDLQDIIDDLYMVSTKLKNLNLHEELKKASSIVDTLALLQIRAQDHINDDV